MHEPSNQTMQLIRTNFKSFPMTKTAFLYPLLFCLILACSPAQENVSEIIPTPPPEKPTPPAISHIKDASTTLLRATGDSVLDALKQPDMVSLGKWIHPEWKLHFSPYGYLDKQEGETLSGPEIQAAFEKTKILHWGLFDGSGDHINVSVQAYLRRFVLDEDFKNAPAISVDSVMGRGNTLLNMKEVYPEARFVEYYFPGTEDQGFMNWKTLRLLFQQREGRLWLVCIAHDQWTI
jgi:hypothetical protein